MVIDHPRPRPFPPDSVANDALYLPKSTNMGLPAWMSTGEKYNYEDEDEGVTSSE